MICGGMADRSTPFWIALLCCSTLVTLCGAVSSPKVIYGYEDPSKNLIKNPSFEDDFASNKGDWYPVSAQYSFVDDAHTGSRSIRVFDRSASSGGVTQTVNDLKAETTYYLSMFVKIPKDPETSTFGSFRIQVSTVLVDGTKKNHNTGRLPKLRAASHWRQLGCDFTTGLAVKSLTIRYKVEPVDFEFLIDSVSLIELPFDQNWKRQTDIDIDKYRRNMLTLGMYVPKKLNAFCKVKVTLRHKKHHFGFGSAMKADVFNRQDAFGEKYREFFFKTFDWAVFENDMKWKPMEKKKNSRKLGRVDTSLDYLEAENVTVRGHSVLWSVPDSNPSWVQSLTGDDLLDAVNTRIDYVVEHYKGRLIQWDVLNEYLHADFYTKTIGDPLLIDKVHKRVHSIDPDVDIVVNDYQGIRDGELTSALVDLANTLKKRNVPVHGIGIQGHMRYVPVSPHIIKKRLEIATSIGLPVTLTEISIHSTNVSLRAWQLEVLLRMAFSNPGVRGFVLWEFSDLDEIAFESDSTALFTGADYTPNEAGAVLQKLLKRWKTSKNYFPKARYMQERILAYHGLYEAKIYYKDRFIKNVTFYLHPGQDLKLNIPLTAAEVKDVADDDPDTCGVWDNENDDSDQTTNPRNKGRAYSRLQKSKKKTKIQVKPYVKGRNVATK